MTTIWTITPMTMILAGEEGKETRVSAKNSPQVDARPNLVDASGFSSPPLFASTVVEALPAIPPPKAWISKQRMSPVIKRAV